MSTDIASAPRPKPTLYSEIFLIPLAMGFQYFSCTDLYFITNTIGKIDPSSTTMITNTFLLGWFLISFIGKVSGAYFFGKLAEQLSFFTLMRLITIGYIFIAFLILTILITGADFYVAYKSFYIARFLYSLLMYASIILPAVYLFNKYPMPQHILIGTYIILANYIARFFSHVLVTCVPHLQMKAWYSLPLIVTFISFFIYRYVEKHSSSLNKPEMLKKHSASLKHKKICALVGAGWDIGLIYYYFFITPYLKNICIIECSDAVGGNSIFYTAYLLFLYPAAKVCEKFGAFKTMITSLFCVLGLGFLIPFVVVSHTFCLIPRILLAFFSACLLAPSLTILYQLFKNTNSLFDTIFWFALGSSISTLLISFGSRIGFSYYFPLTGAWIFAVCILACLMGVLRYSRTAKDT